MHSFYVARTEAFYIMHNIEARLQSGINALKRDSKQVYSQKKNRRALSYVGARKQPEMTEIVLMMSISFYIQNQTNCIC